jgi:hypothetical protein
MNRHIDQHYKARNGEAGSHGTVFPILATNNLPVETVDER